MIAQAIVSIWRFLRSLLHLLRVLWAAHPCGAAQPAAVVNRSRVCSINSEAGLGIGSNGLGRSDVHGSTPRCSVLAMLLRGAREMQH